jgi:CHAT domain-containing protein
MVRVALIEYFTTPHRTLIFLVKKGLKVPLVIEAQAAPHLPLVTNKDLSKCQERLLVDFHGLPREWDSGPEAANFNTILSLPPPINAGKRSQPIREQTLKNPRFSYDLTYWEDLSESLLPNTLKNQIADCELLCFVPHGPLHSLPLAALRWSKKEYLIERFGLCTVPSASVLRYCQAKNRQRLKGPIQQANSCLAVAVAAADDLEPQIFEADADALTAFFQDHIKDSKVTRLVGPSGKDGSNPASKTLIQQMLPCHEVVHLACHGVFGSEIGSDDPLDSGLLVSDGSTTIPLRELIEAKVTELSRLSPYLMTAREVFNLQLCADLVTLRACSSGRSTVESGDELIGLTRAFLFAGAVSLIVSLWNVNQRSSQRLLNDFYQLWLDPQRPLAKWQALQQAQLNLLHDQDYGHPYHWAPFILVGDWL